MIAISPSGNRQFVSCYEDYGTNRVDAPQFIEFLLPAEGRPRISWRKVLHFKEPFGLLFRAPFYPENRAATQYAYVTRKPWQRHMHINSYIRVPTPLWLYAATVVEYEIPGRAWLPLFRVVPHSKNLRISKRWPRVVLNENDFSFEGHWRSSSPRSARGIKDGLPFHGFHF